MDAADAGIGNALSLHLQGISKAFDGQAALDRADFALRRGEVHALLGENGAGKSTLMNVVCGLYSADAGLITVNGEAAQIDSPTAASRLGIAMVHQHFKLVGAFSVAENILLACGPRLGLKNRRQAAAALRTAAAKLGFKLDPGAHTGGLSVAERQRLEIVKLVLLGTELLILDEPTAVLTDTEADQVLGLLKNMAADGKSVVLITHRLQDVSRYADRVTVMRGGRTVLAGAPAQRLGQRELAQLMVGEPLAELSPAAAQAAAARTAADPPRLQVNDLSVARDDGSIAVRHFGLSVHAGEIVALAGVGGNGQTELGEALFGLRPATGKIAVDGRPLAGLSIRRRRARGLRLVPADRYAYALLADLSAAENLALSELADRRFGPWWWLRRGALHRHAARVFARARIGGGKPATRTRLLSGGNAQKLLLARELTQDTSVLIAHSPTRGLDVRACLAVHQAILDSVRGGAACLLISEDLDEVLTLAGRVAVLSAGRLYGPFPRAETDRARIGELMAGHV